MSAARTIDAIHAQGGLVIAPHAFHPIRYTRRGHAPLAHALGRLRVDALETVNNSGPLARIYDAHAAVANERWRLPVVGGSDAHDVRYVGSALTRFEGTDSLALRAALAAGRTHAHRNWRWRSAELVQLFLLKTASFLAYRRIVGARGRELAGAPPRAVS
jgi:predicted metal-dependent phosphoesterase TrpH